MVAQHVIMRRLEAVINGHHFCEALKIAVNKIAEVHNEGEVELVIMRDAFSELLGRLAVLAHGAGLLAVLTIGHCAELE